jgi:hypothetical protein
LTDMNLLTLKAHFLPDKISLKVIPLDRPRIGRSTLYVLIFVV